MKKMYWIVLVFIATIVAYIKPMLSVFLLSALLLGLIIKKQNEDDLF
ncbi:MAG: hypothetical protein BWY04_01007 [candidate division CPR1 bacterium ADurb.Bin160]|uniref:Uncharacterized protein n=1 Tax=candidate division CPR1 bacterium ADurb.Bin160 TaxID=1852826 RepID=A0A1V5ZLW1_9BACT|nr:MAG: hypothetical protein BWY04_01007 [candidate division CPR1 bacterium ADurb.Bin160]